MCYSEGLGATILLFHDIEMGLHLKSSGGLVAGEDKDSFKVFFIEYLFGMISSMYLVWYWEGSKKMSRACVNQEDSLPARQKAVAKERKFPHYQNCFVKTLKTIRNAP